MRKRSSEASYFDTLVKQLLRWCGRGTGFNSCLFHLPGKPVPCPRPRVTRQGFVYYPQNYKDWKAAAAEHVPVLPAQLEGELAASILIRCPPLKTVTRGDPVGDVDNYAKSVLDLVTGTGRIYHDDRQVVRLMVEKMFHEEPGIDVYIREL